MRRVLLLKLPNGREPFTEWKKQLSIPEQVAVTRFILRIAEGGGQKNIKPLGKGVFEIKIHFSSGLRVYFGEGNNNVLILITGGNKRTQSRDIEKAKKYWKKYTC